MLSLKLSFKSAKDPANLYIFIVDDTLKEQQMKYQKIVQPLDRILYLIWKQGISCQGVQKTAANSDTLWNPRNFLAIVRQVKHRHFLFYEHIRSTLQKDLFYMSQPSQNELIGIIAKCPIQISVYKWSKTDRVLKSHKSKIYM